MGVILTESQKEEVRRLCMRLERCEAVLYAYATSDDKVSKALQSVPGIDKLEEQLLEVAKGGKLEASLPHQDFVDVIERITKCEAELFRREHGAPEPLQLPNPSVIAEHPQFISAPTNPTTKQESSKISSAPQPSKSMDTTEATENSFATVHEHLVTDSMKIGDGCENEFKQLKTRRKHRYLIYQIIKGVISVTKIGNKTEGLDDFLKQLPPSGCCYAVYDHEYKTRDGRSTDKLLFVTWCARSADTNTKMLYATERSVIAKFITGAFDLNASTTGEIKDYLGLDAEDDPDNADDDEDWLDD